MESHVSSLKLTIFSCLSKTSGHWVVLRERVGNSFGWNLGELMWVMWAGGKRGADLAWHSTEEREGGTIDPIWPGPVCLEPTMPRKHMPTGSHLTPVKLPTGSCRRFLSPLGFLRGKWIFMWDTESGLKSVLWLLNHNKKLLSG